MADIHFMRPDGSKEVFAEERIAELREKGMLYSFTYFWKEGMAEWRPVHELTDGFRPFGEAVTFKRDVRKPAAFVKGMMYVLISFILFNTFFYTMGSQLSDSIRDGVFLPVYITLNILEIFLLILLVADFMRFVYAANVNARWFGAEDMRYSPAWAVGCFFVPVVNLVMPYFVLSEIHRGSEDPVNWKSFPIPMIVNIWWILAIVLLVCSIVFFIFFDSFLFNSHLLSGKISLSLVFLIRAVLNISFCVLSIRIVKKITAMQTAWVEGRRGNGAAAGG